MIFSWCAATFLSLSKVMGSPGTLETLIAEETTY